MLMCELHLRPVKNVSPQPKLFKDGGSSAKLVYKLEEVSRMTKIDPETIDSWEKEFPFLRAGRAAGGKRFFRPKDVEIIQRIKDLLDKKSLTMAGIKRRIEEEFGLRQTGPVHPDTLKKALYDVRDDLQEIADSLHTDSKKLR